MFIIPWFVYWNGFEYLVDTMFYHVQPLPEMASVFTEVTHRRMYGTVGCTVNGYD